MTSTSYSHSFTTTSAPSRILAIYEVLRRRHLDAALIGALLAGLVFVAAHRSLVDDAYITADYARSLADHGTWGLEPGLTANTATSPLNVLLLAGLTLLTGAPVVAIGLLFLLSVSALAMSMSAVAVYIGGNRVVLIAMALLLPLNPLLVSTIGLETVLAVALVAALGWAIVARLPWAAGLLCGLLAVTRADLAVLALPGLLVAARDRPVAVLISAALPTVPWYVGSWLFLGSAVPDTSLLKVGDQWGPWSYGNGLLLYLDVYPAATLLALAPLVLLIATPVLVPRVWASTAGPRRRLAIAWGAGGALSVATYLVLHPAPYHWYYGPALGALVLLGGAATACLQGWTRPVGTALIALVGVTSVVFLAQRSWTTAPITTNWASAQQYAEAAALVRPGGTVRSPGEIGTLAYFCDCTVVDEFSDRSLLARRIAVVRSTSSPLRRMLLDLNYVHLRVPEPLEPDEAFSFGDGPGPGIATSTPWRQSGHLAVVSDPG